MAPICVQPGGFGVLIAILVLESLTLIGLYLQPYYLKWRNKHDLDLQARGKGKKKKKKPGAADKQPWEIDPRKIKYKDKLAKGNFGEVWLGSWLGSPVAIKTVIGTMAQDSEFIERFVLEIKLMSNLHHPNIVMFLGAVVTPVEKMCLLLEFCVHGNLHEFMKADHEDLTITMHTVLKFATDIARGIHYIHQKKNIIQRDLKSRNVLIDEHLNAKVADFGLSRLKEDDQGMTACGTPAWTAPEIVKMENYDEKVDVYSFGIVMWELIMREEPYDGQGGVQIAYAAAEQGLRPTIPMFCPDNYSELMQRCWAEKPDDRPDFGEILETLFQFMKADNPQVLNGSRLRDMPKKPRPKHATSSASQASGRPHGIIDNLKAGVRRMTHRGSAITSPV